MRRGVPPEIFNLRALRQLLVQSGAKICLTAVASTESYDLVLYVVDMLHGYYRVGIQERGGGGGHKPFLPLPGSASSCMGYGDRTRTGGYVGIVAKQKSGLGLGLLMEKKKQ